MNLGIKFSAHELLEDIFKKIALCILYFVQNWLLFLRRLSLTHVCAFLPRKGTSLIQGAAPESVTYYMKPFWIPFPTLPITFMANLGHLCWAFLTSH
jgi:hypothetical protein